VLDGPNVTRGTPPDATLSALTRTAAKRRLGTAARNTQNAVRRSARPSAGVLCSAAAIELPTEVPFAAPAGRRMPFTASENDRLTEVIAAGVATAGDVVVLAVWALVTEPDGRALRVVETLAAAELLALGGTERDGEGALVPLALPAIDAAALGVDVRESEGGGEAGPERVAVAAAETLELGLAPTERVSDGDCVWVGCADSEHV